MAYTDPDRVQSLVGAPIVWGQGLAPTEYFLGEIIRRQGDLIDGFCRDRYDTPFSPVPDLIGEIATDLTLAAILPVIFHRNPEQLTRAASLRAWALQRLDRIQNNQLSVVADDDASAGMGGRVTWTAPIQDRVFTADQDY